MPTYSQTDLSIQQEFKLGGAKRVQLSLNVLNLFNQDTATNRFITYNDSSQGVQFNEAAFYASYMWSRLYGNYSGLSQSDEDGRVAPNVGRVYDNAFVMFDQEAQPVYGLLATDRPHQFKGQVVYQAPFRLSVGVFQFVGSGLPVTREVAVVPGSNFPMQYLGRLSDGRTPTLSQTDLYVQQDIGTGWRQSRFSIGFSVTNLFNQDAAISKYPTETEQGTAIALSEEDFFAGRFDVQQSMSAQKIATDARFLLPNGFQAPRVARVLLKWSF
jgi:hypothetical protein